MTTERKKIVTSVLNEWNLLPFDKKEYYIEKAKLHLEGQWGGNNKEFLNYFSPKNSATELEVEQLAMDLFAVNIYKHIEERIKGEGGIWTL